MVIICVETIVENGFGCVWETDAVGKNHALFIKQFELRLMDYIID